MSDTGYDIAGTLQSSQPSSSGAPARSDDPAWKHAFLDPNNKKHVICIHCKKFIKGGGITRLKEHLAGITGDIAPSKSVSGEVKWQMERMVMETEKKRYLNKEIGNPQGTPIDDEELEEEEVEIEEITPLKLQRGNEPQISSFQNHGMPMTSKVPQGRPMTNFQPRTTPGSRQSIRSSMATKEQKDAADMTMASWWFDPSLPLNAANSKFFQPMANAITSVGPGYKVPTYDALRGKLLKNLVEEVNALMKHYKSSWSETGCSIMADGWTDGRQKSLINFLIYCPKGVLFFKSVDTSAVRKNADALFGLFEDVISIGPQNVCCAYALIKPHRIEK